jgi:hypothetical protein
MQSQQQRDAGESSRAIYHVMLLDDTLERILKAITWFFRRILLRKVLISISTLKNIDYNQQTFRFFNVFLWF